MTKTGKNPPVKILLWSEIWAHACIVMLPVDAGFVFNKVLSKKKKRQQQQSTKHSGIVEAVNTLIGQK